MYILLCTKKKIESRDDSVLAFKKANQNTQEVKNERFFNVNKTKQCANFRHNDIYTLTKRKATCAENSPIVVLSTLKSVHFLTSCVFRFVYIGYQCMMVMGKAF